METTWIPISNTPIKGEDVLLTNDTDRWVVCGYLLRGKYYNTFDESGCEIFPTHWMPLPEPPVKPKV